MIVLRCLMSVGISCRIKITILSLENAQNLIVIEPLSNVVDEFFRLSNGTAFTGRFGSFIDPASKAFSGPAIYLASAGGVMI